MHLETLQSISLNGSPGRPNDDRYGATSHLAWVIDGATDMGAPGLLGGQGGAAWLASAASQVFATAEGSGDFRSTCQGVFAQIETRFHQQKSRDVTAAWEVPKAAFAALQLAPGKLSVAWAADCPILQISGDDIRWCTGTPNTGAEAADALALGEGIGATQGITGAVLEDRRAHRARPDHVALSTNGQASANVTSYADHPVSEGDELLLMSDGFASLVTDYKRYSAGQLAEAVRSKGLAQVAEEIRAVEAEDAACLRFPRFKISDDATALWLRVAAG
ncbi:hypothetical protein AIOL_002309 [Candidatus Rhodobacter oscarellae]|uniref:PPM-type phosphatase domain-containing protein n=1 Tax=Candidatus Rhodobacter oscarellae TaxID=1675527 RepID=A0A0J9E3E8_9RHOB|nr:protein phosphatase 2C domain-containing protein [Candidatus Rhodobacter lobularis]KMW57346.1 hypothetical protein AIOL_002309 [Candidatus Rhodobacter lobularis]